MLRQAHNLAPAQPHQPALQLQLALLHQLSAQLRLEAEPVRLSEEQDRATGIRLL